MLDDNSKLKDNLILIVDDVEDNVFLLDTIVTSHGYKTLTASNGEEAIKIIKSQSDKIDLIILDLVMPIMSGYEVTKEVKNNINSKYIPIILLTAKVHDNEDIAKGLDLGADDFLNQSVDSVELMARIRSIQRTKYWQDKLTTMNKNLEDLVEERSIEVLLTRNAAIFGLAKLAEYRDPKTGGHLERIRNYTKALSTEMAANSKYSDEITEEFIATIYQSSPLHDIGKVGISDGILLKPGELNDQKWAIMKTHPSIGGDALSSSETFYDGDIFLSMGRDIANYHHENGMEVCIQRD